MHIIHIGNFDVIQRAKYNVEAYFSLVGMSYDLKRSFELLEVLLSAYFSNAKSIFREDLRFNKTRTSYRNGRNIEALIFENLKPVEITKKLFQHHLNILKNV